MDNTLEAHFGIRTAGAGWLTDHAIRAATNWGPAIGAPVGTVKLPAVGLR
jgi:hypothetical protein